MSLSQPSPQETNPAITAPIQQAFNEQAGVNQIGLNAINQVTPFGSLTYTGTPGHGMTATQQLSPEVQALLAQFQRTQGTLGGTAGNLAANTAAMYGSAPDFTSLSSPLVKAQMDAFNKYMAPTYAIQQSNLDSRLQNQGIPQGSTAWNNAERSYQLSQDQAAQQALMQFEPQAFSQAMATYQAPLQTIAGLFGASAPQGTTQPFVTTPQASVQPPNYMGGAQNFFQNQQNQYQQTGAGLGQIAGGLMTGLFGGPGGLGSAVGGLFGGLGGGIDPFPGGTFNPNG